MGEEAAMPATKSEATTGTKRALSLSTESSAQLARRYQPLVAPAFAVAAGLVWSRYGARLVLSPASAETPGSGWLLIWIGLCVAFLVAWLVAWRRQHDALAAWVLLAAVVWAGAAYHELRWFLYETDELGRYAAFEPAPACVEAIALGAPERVTAPPPTPLRAIPAGERSRLTISLTKIRDGAQWRAASGVCQLSVEGHLLGVHQGDRLRVLGQLARVSPQQNPGEFDFAAHARAESQLARIRSKRPESISVVEQGSWWNVGRWLDVAQSRAKERVRSLIGPRHAGLAAAILLGAREGLPFEATESYLTTGTVHILVVSGMNVAILASGMLAMMRLGWLPRRLGLCLIAAVVVAYALLAGADPPVVRAAVFGVLVCIAAWSGRRSIAFNSIFAVALFVIALNPNDMFRAGPQLSFLAVGVLIWLSTWVEKNVDRLDEMIAASKPWHVRFVKRIGRWIWLYWLVLSTVLWLATLPLVLHQFHVASPVAILIHPAIWIIMFVAMWSGFFMLVVGWIAPIVAVTFAAICNVALDCLERVVQFAETLPGGHVWLPGPAWWWVVGFYLGLIMAMIWGRRIMPPRWQLAGLAAWMLIGFMPFLTRHWNRDGLDCTIVAVGHGECVLLQSPSGETLLYDAGGIGSPEYATQSIASVLWDRGLTHIDGIVISHADVDHYNAIPGLLERFSVNAIYVSPVMFHAKPDANDSGPTVLLEAIHRAGVPLHEVWSGDVLRMGADVAVQVLHPTRKGVVGTDNANSVTLGIEYVGRRILLPGDLESPGIEDVMAEAPYDCDLLLAPHHGSRRSDPPGFASWSTPEYVVLSGGGGEQAAPVIHAYEDAGAQVFVTDEVGAVRLEVAPDSAMRLTTFRSPKIVFAQPPKPPAAELPETIGNL